MSKKAKYESASTKLQEALQSSIQIFSSAMSSAVERTLNEIQSPPPTASQRDTVGTLTSTVFDGEL